MKYHKLNIPTPDVAFRRYSARVVLPSNWEEFTLPQEELQEGPSASSDLNYLPQDDQEPHLIQQSEPNDLACDLNLSKQQAELGSRQQQWNL